MLLEATGHYPPKDVGGPWGYQEFREALADPAHERLEWWCSSDYNPNSANFSQLNKAVDDLAAKWARKARRKT